MIYMYIHVLYGGKLSREKTFSNFAVLELFVKVFSTKFGGMVYMLPVTWCTLGAWCTLARQNPQKFFPRKSFLQNFSPSKVFHYTVPHTSVYIAG